MLVDRKGLVQRKGLQGLAPCGRWPRAGGGRALTSSGGLANLKWPGVADRPPVPPQVAAAALGSVTKRALQFVVGDTDRCCRCCRAQGHGGRKHGQRCSLLATGYRDSVRHPLRRVATGPARGAVGT
eukprot:scaffold13714_cov56-Phaeocystis_antarctica.AAC.1